MESKVMATINDRINLIRFLFVSIQSEFVCFVVGCSTDFVGRRLALFERGRYGVFTPANTCRTSSENMNTTGHLISTGCPTTVEQLMEATIRHKNSFVVAGEFSSRKKRRKQWRECRWEDARWRTVPNVGMAILRR
jgi:hypothetical protein